MFVRHVAAVGLMIFTFFANMIDVQSVPIVGGEPVPEHGWFYCCSMDVFWFCLVEFQYSTGFFADQTFSFAASIQYREFNETSKRYTYKHFCGGVLLQVYNRTAYVITASHCMTNM